MADAEWSSDESYYSDGQDSGNGFQVDEEGQTGSELELETDSSDQESASDQEADEASSGMGSTSEDEADGNDGNSVSERSSGRKSDGNPRDQLYHNEYYLKIR